MKKEVLKNELDIEKYHYKVEVYIGTFGVYTPYVHTEIITHEDLKIAEFKAIKRAKELKLMLIQQGSFFLPFAPSNDIVPEKKAFFSITVLPI